ncbi:hypothetical protein SASPL_120790 [Salvia splendens]|uniref:Uncharacterized protein n=1 Tax=Salvia splendens TaxID=180675 RepID=A0A8X8ZVZ2_SALSN|nr:hypothetical protein SASPL_120790 [Salvia splendens]
MRRYQRGGHWNHPHIYKDTNAHWRVQEAGGVTTRDRAALAATATTDQLTNEEEGEQNTPPQQPPLEQAKAEMALANNDSGVLAVLSNFYGLSKECPYAFLEKFCRYCDIQPVPAGSTSEDYRLKAIPFILKGDTGVWLSRLPEGSIRTWDF